MIEPTHHSLAQLLLEHLQTHGPQPFQWFMEQALYHPEHGYYASGRAVIGRQGDFLTNVSVGPLYGRLIGIQMEEMWRRMECPVAFTIVEQGAANGDFAHDLLSSLAGAFREAVRYVIVEPFPAWKSRQVARLEGFACVAWVDSLSALTPFTGVHFSNELLDAFPVQRLAFRKGIWIERYVEARGDQIAWCDGPPATGSLPPPAEEGVETEICPQRLAWLDALTARLERGYILVVDYGFPREVYHLPERREGTLTGYAHHQRVEDLLQSPGEVDLTAHVEFTSLAEHAATLDLQVAGFTDQHHFITALGLQYFKEGEAAQTPAAQKERRAFMTLMHPQFMGLGFQVMALVKNMPIRPPLSGFSLAPSLAFQ
ncbi:MAG: SAM-dependent methyltransferase [Chthoniobacteraceae bacterium]